MIESQGPVIPYLLLFIVGALLSKSGTPLLAQYPKLSALLSIGDLYHSLQFKSGKSRATVPEWLTT